MSNIGNKMKGKKTGKNYTGFPGLMRMHQTKYDVQIVSSGALKLRKIGY